RRTTAMHIRPFPSARPRDEHESAGRRGSATSTSRKGSTMHTVTSKDGTRIGYDRLGSGPALILISAGPVDRTATAPLAELLAARFTVINYDRRGRGDSGDSTDYALDRE